MSDITPYPQGTGRGGEGGWTDQHGNVGHWLLGRVELLDYAPPRLGRDWLDDDVIGIIEIREEGDATTHPVYLPRDMAEKLLDALARELGMREALPDEPTGHFMRDGPEKCDQCDSPTAELVHAESGEVVNVYCCNPDCSRSRWL